MPEHKTQAQPARFLPTIQEWLGQVFGIHQDLSIPDPSYAARLSDSYDIDA